MTVYITVGILCFAVLTAGIACIVVSSNIQKHALAIQDDAASKLRKAAILLGEIKHKELEIKEATKGFRYIYAWQSLTDEEKAAYEAGTLKEITIKKKLAFRIMSKLINMHNLDKPKTGKYGELVFDWGMQVRDVNDPDVTQDSLLPDDSQSQSCFGDNVHKSK